MDDLVVLRNLIRSTSVRDQSVDSGALFRKVAFESQFGRIIARANSAINIKTLVLTLEYLGIRPIRACVGAADSVEWYTRWYGRLLRTVVHIDVKDDQFILFHRAMQTIYRLAKAHASGAVRGDSDCVSRPTRPAPSVYRDRLKRTISISQSYTTKHAQASSRSSASSPKVQLSPSQSSTPSSRASPQASSFTPSYQGVHLDPFPSIAARNDHDHSAYVPPPPDDGSESPFPNTQLPTLD